MTSTPKTATICWRKKNVTLNANMRVVTDDYVSQDKERGVGPNNAATN